MVVNDLTQIITNIYDRFGSSKNLLLYVECTLYYIINVGNIENPGLFVEALNKVPLAGVMSIRNLMEPPSSELMVRRRLKLRVKS